MGPKLLSLGACAPNPFALMSCVCSLIHSCRKIERAVVANLCNGAIVNGLDSSAATADGPAIKEASELLGVPAPTLRSWERRYGIPVASRSVGGHRRYAEDELNQLRLMRDEIARGKRASDAALAVRVLLDQATPEREWIDRVLAGSEATHPDTIRAVLDESREAMGLSATIDGVLMPALRQIGAWWESGRCDVKQEHLTTETARSWLARITTLMPHVRYEPPVLLACGPRDMHTIGLEALAALLAEGHRGCRILGARTSEATLIAAAQSSGAAAVVVVSQLHTHRRAAVDAVTAVDTAGFPAFYGGNAFAFPGERRNVPGTYLSESFVSASSIILKALADEASQEE